MVPAVSVVYRKPCTATRLSMQANETSEAPQCGHKKRRPAYLGQRHPSGLHYHRFHAIVHIIQTEVNLFMLITFSRLGSFQYP
jgi:hypothetical protein